jgi:hypothetical protein
MAIGNFLIDSKTSPLYRYLAEYGLFVNFAEGYFEYSDGIRPARMKRSYRD